MSQNTKFIAILWYLVGIFFATCLREDNIHPLVVDYHDNYYYKSLRDKMFESMSVNNCTLGGDIKYGSGKVPDLTVELIPPPQNIIEKWGDKGSTRLDSRIFAQVSDNLCSHSKFKDLKRGFYKRAKGCYKVYMTDKNGVRRKRFNDYGATLHPEHIRCDNTIATEICESGSNGLKVVDKSLRQLHNYPFLITAKNVIIGRGGMFGMPCGPFGLFASCEAVKWGIPYAAATVSNVTICRNNESKCPFPIYDEVFIMTQYDDTQIGQFMQEALPKLIYHLDFLLKNPQIKIHYGFTKQPTVPSYVLPHNFFHTFGLTHRLINGTFYSHKIYMPREGGCQDIGYNAWEVVTMRERFLKLLNIKETKDFKIKINKNNQQQQQLESRKPTVLILTRSPGAYTQNKADYTTRRWPKDKLPIFIEQMTKLFPTHSIEIFSDQNTTLMTCPLCQALAFYQADIVIGYHGAGLSNAMFMRPGGVVVEVIYDFDSRHAPIIGIFPRMSSIIGLHHYSFFIRDVPGGLDPIKLANETYVFANKARLWA